MDFIMDNLGTICVLIVVGGIITAVIAGMVKDKKSGRNSCCGGCKGCANAGLCHKDK